MRWLVATIAETVPETIRTVTLRLDVPDWLNALEDEVTAARSRLNHASSSDRLSRRIGQVCLSWTEILEQLGEG